MATGTIVRLSDRGYGFISHDGNDLFFHAKDMKTRSTFDALQVGDQVEYQLDTTGDRPRATSVFKR